MNRKIFYCTENLKTKTTFAKLVVDHTFLNFNTYAIRRWKLFDFLSTRETN